VFIVLFVMVLLCAELCRRIPLLVVVPSVWMMFSEIMLSEAVPIRKMPRFSSAVPCVFIVFFVTVLLIAEVCRRIP